MRSFFSTYEFSKYVHYISLVWTLEVVYVQERKNVLETFKSLNCLIHVNSAIQTNMGLEDWMHGGLAHWVEDLGTYFSTRSGCQICTNLYFTTRYENECYNFKSIQITKRKKKWNKITVEKCINKHYIVLCNFVKVDALNMSPSHCVPFIQRFGRFSHSHTSKVVLI